MPGTATKWANWERRRGGSPVGPLGGTDVIAGNWSPRVELYIDESWVDITRTSASEPGVFYEDRITISRGRADENQTANPSTCTFTLNNRDGRFSPSNPRSPYFGKIGRNTRVRVSVLQNGIRRYRFYGEISSWPVQSDVSGQDIRVQIQASGVTRRVSQGSSPLKSAVFRDMTSPKRTHIKAYWPLEDGMNSTNVAGGLANQLPAKILSGAVDFGAYSDWFATDPLANIGTGRIKGTVPPYTSTGETSIRFFVYVTTAVSGTYQNLISWTMTGSLPTWELALRNNGDLRLTVYDSDGVRTDTADMVYDLNQFGFAMLTIEVTQDGADVDWRILRTGPWTNTTGIHDSIGAAALTGTFTSETTGRVTSVTIGKDGGLGDVAIGHLTVGDSLSSYANSQSPFVGWSDESPRDRFRRILDEEGIDHSDVGISGNGTLLSNVTMGIQRSQTLVEILQGCEDTDMGLLYEPRDFLGVSYRTRAGLYNQVPVLTLDEANNELASPLNPVYDDQKIVNDVTLTRTDGSFVRTQQLDGPMSILDPPNGVGQYDTGPSMSLATDDQLADQAGWILHRGTVSEARYPAVSIQLSHPSFTSNLDLTNAALMVDIGDRIVVENPADELTAEDVSLIVVGYTETFDQFLYDMTFNTTPESPYEIGIVDDTPEWRVDTDGSELTNFIDETQTSISVTVTDGALWTTDSNEWPFDIRCSEASSSAGEVMTVTAVNGSSSPQTFTVTRSVNGVVRAHDAGTDIRLAQPAIVSL